MMKKMREDEGVKQMNKDRQLSELRIKIQKMESDKTTFERKVRSEERKQEI